MAATISRPQSQHRSNTAMLLDETNPSGGQVKHMTAQISRPEYERKNTIVSDGPFS